MTTVEILYRYATPPTEQVAVALAHARDVYGIRQLRFDRAAHTLRIEYDATRLNAAEVTKLVREAGLDIVERVAKTTRSSPRLRRLQLCRQRPSPIGPVVDRAWTCADPMHRSDPASSLQRCSAAPNLALLLGP